MQGSVDLSQKNYKMISIATFKNEKAGVLLRDQLAVNGIESTLFEKVAFNSANNIATNKVSVLIQLMDEERAVEIMEEIGSELND